MQDKVSLRAHYLRLLREQDKSEVVRKSLLIAGRFWELPEITKARSILFYVSMPGEVDTSAIIKKAFSLGKRVVLPIVEQNQRKLIPTLISSMEEVRTGAYGIGEPPRDPHKEVRDLDAVVVPGLAFDSHRYRLGRGAGYYDRFLSTLPQETVSVGLAFDFQLTERLPREAHDMRLTHVVAG